MLMYLNKSLSTVLTLTLITAVLAINTCIAQADKCQYVLWVCIILGKGGNSGPPNKPPDEQIARLKNAIREEKATGDDYLLLGYFYGLQKKYPQSESSYRQGLQRATDVNQQAIAQKGLADVFVATGKKEQAVLNLREAQKLYETLEQKQQVIQIQQQLIQLRKR
ncbi:tetratricopeptide repeat protein [Nostoc punctiforme]|uniref:Tetratricopeptide domain protein n=1 Tax=Nostoc punctiforme (strain ATCC 29133 / PCC 73102) TaxID=63737 RepID=B2IT76_NOSP7|nr:tetratricopeptide repeat protein [Nostoc punctiforme]ACC79574.1 Tetratricopeptide domain protein [Nostoc punctiforme PCC 73102]